MCHKFMIHPLLVVGWVRICRCKSKDMLLEEIGYVVEAVSIFGRTTAVVRLYNSWYAHAQQVMCMRCSTVMRQTIIQTYDAPSSGTPSGLALQFTPVGLGNRWRVVKSGWRVAVNSSPLEMPINTGVSEGKVKSEEEKRVRLQIKNGAQAVSRKGIACAPWYFCLWVNEHPKIRTCR